MNTQPAFVQKTFKHFQLRDQILFAFISIIITAGMSLLFHACSIHPLAWQPEPKPPFTGELALNEKLNTIQKIGLNSDPSSNM